MFDTSSSTSDFLLPLGTGLRALSVAEQIAAMVGELILVETLKPGEPVTEVSLGHQFSVSRGPVREALRLLEQEGLIEIIPRKGAQVTLLTAKEVNEIFEIRALLLGHAVRLVARQQGASCRTLLSEGFRRLTENFESARDIDAHLRISLRMKLIICEHSQNTHLLRMVGRLVRHTARYSRLAIASDAMKENSIGTWRELLEHIENGNEDAAEAIERGRIIEFKQKMVELLNRRERQGI